MPKFPSLSASKLAQRKGFILHVYAILLAQILVMTAILWKTRQHPEFAKKFCSLGMRLLSVALVVALIMIMYFMRPFLGYPGQLLVLVLITLTLSFTIQCLTGRFVWADVQRALIAAALVFVVMSVIGYVTIMLGWDLSFLGQILFAFLVGLIVTGLIFIFFPPSSKVKRIFHVVAIILFSIYVMYDTNLIVMRPILSAPEAALNFFIDFANIFVNTLGAGDG